MIGFAVASRERVDAFYTDLVAASHRGHQPPYDTFWGAGYAIIDDPNGNTIGLMSLVEGDRKFWTPTKPPFA